MIKFKCCGRHADEVCTLINALGERSAPQSNVVLRVAYLCTHGDDIAALFCDNYRWKIAVCWVNEAFSALNQIITLVCARDCSLMVTCEGEGGFMGGWVGGGVGFDQLCLCMSM